MGWGAGHPAGVVAGTLIAEGTAVVTGAPAWVELSVPVITGMFALALYLLKDHLAAKRAEGKPTDAQRLVESLEREVSDLRAQLHRSNSQLDLASSELRALRREMT